MRLGYFTMPVHPLERSPTETLHEDRQAIILADKLGFHDAFVGEHLTERTENITNSMLFLATLISDTKTIKLATGTSNLSQSHPVLIASHAAMFDHLAKGRFIFGISAGVLRCDAEALGNLDDDRNKMFADAIEVILAIWERESPYDIDFPDNRYKVSVAKTRDLEIGRGHLYKPYQKPRPEIVGTVVAPHSKGVIAMGERDFHPLSANFLLSKWLPSHWDNYSEGKRNAGQVADRADWRIARTIFVADDDKVARRYGRDDADSPYRYYWRMLLYKMMKAKRHVAFGRSIHSQKAVSPLRSATAVHVRNELAQSTFLSSRQFAEIETHGTRIVFVCHVRLALWAAAFGIPELVPDGGNSMEKCQPGLRQ